MPHVAFVPFTGLRIREEELLHIGMHLPGLKARTGAIERLPALGLLTLAGMTPTDWECSYHEGEAPDENLVERVLAARPDVVAISALTASAEEAYRFGTAMNAAGVFTVFGGLHATACPTEVQNYFSAVVVGDGESVWKELLDDYEQGVERRIYHARPFNLKDSPIPRFDLLGSAQRPRFTLQTQRGCPLACDFCAASRLLGPFREKPIENIRGELDAIQSFDRRPTIELADDNTFAGSRDPQPFFEMLSAANVKYFTESDWRLGLRPEVLAGLAASGCVQVLIGIESLVFKHSGMGAKRAALEQMLEAVVAIQESGVAVNGCFIVGSDGETRDSMERLAEFLLESPFADIQLTIQTPFPGTALHRRFQREGRLLPHRGWSSYTLFDVTYQPEPLSAVELQKGFHELIQAVFSATAVEKRNHIRKQIWRYEPTS